MAIAKIILNGVTQMDLTSDTVVKQTLVTGTTAHRADGVMISGAFSPVIPIGTLSITSNGTYDVTNYASANVAVSGGGGGTDPVSLIDRTITEISTSASIIGQNAFANASLLSTVNAPNATEISRTAFLNCYSLNQITAPNVTAISSGAFSNCSSLVSVSFPSCVGSLGSHAFASCTSLVSAYLPGLERIGLQAFGGCTKLSDVLFTSVTSVEAGAFMSCALEVVDNTNFPALYTTGTTQAFYNNKSLLTVSLSTLGSEATALGGSTFTFCSSLATVSITNVSTVPNYCFQNCARLISVYMPSVTTISSYAFNACYLLSDLYMPELTTVGANAFRSCWSLSTLVAPKLKNVYSSAFMNCSQLSFVRLDDVYVVSVSAFGVCVRASTYIMGYNASSSIIFQGNAFQAGYKLLSFYLPNSSIVATLNAVTAFSSTPISNYTTQTSGVNGSIFVHESLYNTYITATNWVTYSARIVSLTDAQVQNVLTYGKHDP